MLNHLVQSSDKLFKYPRHWSVPVFRKFLFYQIKKKVLNSFIFYEPFFPEIALRHLLCFSSLLQLPSSFFFRTINSCRSYNILSGFCWIANTWMIFGCSFNIIVHSKYNLKINTHWIKLNFCINFDIKKQSYVTEKRETLFLDI